MESRPSNKVPDGQFVKNSRLDILIGTKDMAAGKIPSAIRKARGKKIF